MHAETQTIKWGITAKWPALPIVLLAPSHTCQRSWQLAWPCPILRQDTGGVHIAALARMPIKDIAELPKRRGRRQGAGGKGGGGVWFLAPCRTPCILAKIPQMGDSGIVETNAFRPAANRHGNCNSLVSIFIPSSMSERLVPKHKNPVPE